MFEESLKIPKDRIPVLIGTKGNVRKQIELRTKIKLTIDSKEGDVLIKGEDSLMVYSAKLIILSIARGFNPEIAYQLLNENNYLEIINLTDICGKNKTKMARQKSRIIGTEGKCRKTIEQLTNTSICIYGKTVSIIGDAEKAILAKKALEMIIKGTKQTNAYKWLEKNITN